nr:52 kDa repressor of the inhibitor of the protein kinase-like isoform X2 [Pocillopora verrucosa]
MTRGDPVCRREDCSPFDIGLVFDEIHNYSPHQKLEFVENVWKPATDPAWKANVLEFCNHYRQDIPNYAGLQAELLLWERLWKGRDNRGDIIPDSLEATLKDIDKDAYVNIYSMLKVLITIPISPASCERSISSLRNLKNYLRNTMTQDRLNGLALMHARGFLTLNV